MNNESAFGVIHKATEYYGQFIDPRAEKRKESAKQAAAGAAGGATVTAGAGAAGVGYAHHKLKPAIKTYKSIKNFGSKPQDVDRAAKGAYKTWRVVQTLLK